MTARKQQNDVTEVLGLVRAALCEAPFVNALSYLLSINGRETERESSEHTEKSVRGFGGGDRLKCAGDT